MKSYTEYSTWLGKLFPGEKVQKLSVNTSHGCPNRDGKSGRGGCIYCNNISFAPIYCFGCKNVKEQLESGKRFFARKYKKMKYLAYFQSYSSTYAPEEFAEELAEAMSVEDIVGIVVGTRPDCLGERVTGILREASERMPIIVEIGVETLHDETLRLINRGHDSATALSAIRRMKAVGLHPGVHLIAGLPGEDEEMVLESVAGVCEAGAETIKMHQLQVQKGTELARRIARGEMKVPEFTQDEYLDFCVRLVKAVPEGVAIERFLAQAPPELVISPRWGIKNYEFVEKLKKRLYMQQR